MAASFRGLTFKRVAAAGILLGGAGVVGGMAYSYQNAADAARPAADAAPRGRFLADHATPLSPDSLPAKAVREAIASYLAARPKNVVDTLHRCRVDSELPHSGGDTTRGEGIATLVSAGAYRERFPGMPPLYEPGPGGWSVLRRAIEPQRPLDRRVLLGEGHVDQLLACLGEIGVAPGTPVQTGAGTTPVEELVFASQANFVRDQEPFWSVIAYALYGSPRGWTNRFGEAFTFDGAAADLMADDPAGGACAGGHRLYTLTVLLRADARGRLLSAAVEAKARDYLKRAADRLARSQLPSGAWNQDWAAERPSRLARQGLLDRLDHQVLVTGHHLEWLAVAPDGVRPDDEVLTRAARFVTLALSSQGPAQVAENFCAFSHAAGALALLQPDAAPRPGAPE